jgi:glucokinase
MTCNAGVSITEFIAAGIVEGSTLPHGVHRFTDPQGMSLRRMGAGDIVERIQRCVEPVLAGQPVQAIGIALPGMVHRGLVLECLELPQLKGLDLGAMLSSAFGRPATIVNDADAAAAGLTPAHGWPGRPTRVWLLGKGVGFGHFPLLEGIWEAGHCVVTLDPGETLCPCGGRGHMEGIVGEYAMRHRFMDLEPEEIFAGAAEGDQRCASFAVLWHRALAAAVATSIHLEGPGPFFIGGSSAQFVRLPLLDRYLREMVTLSPLLGSVVKVLPISQELQIVGAALAVSDPQSWVARVNHSPALRGQ